ncbi:MAG TPA: flagellin [Caulobacteraceae bacterium]|nr:flagellin [Caulobacteraceae bacterium]
MTVSVHTNQSALVALQNLNKTNDQMAEVQNRINTGYKVAGAKDNASVWAVAQGQRADIGALSAVKMSLDRATSIADVSLAAGESVSDLLIELKEKVVAAMDPSIDGTSRAALNSDFRALLRQIGQVIGNAEFDGANILNGSLSANIRFLANADADAYVTLGVKNMSLGGAIITIAAAASINTATNATAVLTQLDASIANVNSALGEIGAHAKQIEAHNKFVSKLVDTLESGIGNLVDADLAKETAKLQALQVQQQLGVQALSIANSAPQMILSLFRGG